MTNQVLSNSIVLVNIGQSSFSDDDACIIRVVHALNRRSINEENKLVSFLLTLVLFLRTVNNRR